MKSHCSLTQKRCVPCKGGTPPLTADTIQPLLKELKSGWKVIENHHLEKEFLFNDFKEALAFTNKVGSLAEQEDHHPDILLSWGKVKISLWTHKAHGLTENDFILASKCDTLG